MVERTRFKAWITKYALTDGIQESEVEDCLASPTMVRVLYTDRFYHRNEWHRTREEAVVRAEQMRARKIAALKRQIAKLEGLAF